MTLQALKMQMYERLRRRLTNHARHCMMDQHPRRWSNQELRRWAPLVHGDVLNVSGWRDEDKQGGYYRDYFSNAASYRLTNYRGTDAQDDGTDDALYLDLEAPLPESCLGICDLAWTHTVLEHVGDIQTAFGNLARLSRDLVLVVVPWMQDEHYTPGLYGDYWRFTPMGVERLLNQAGMELLYVSANDQPWYPVYLLAIGSHRPQAWAGRFPSPDRTRRLARTTYNYPKCIF